MDSTEVLGNQAQTNKIRIWPKVLGSFLAGLIVSGGVFCYFYFTPLGQNSKSTGLQIQDFSPSNKIKEGNQEKPMIQENKNWIKPVSSKQGYPLLNPDKSNYYIYSISEKVRRPSVIPFGGGGGGGASGLGSSDPSPSPNLLYTAYIDKDKGNLWILSNESLKAQVLTQNGGVTYISSWSPNSQKIIYYSAPDTINSRRNGPIPWEGIEKFVISRGAGFYLFDLETGETKHLYPIEYFESFIDSKNVLVRSNSQSNRLVVFNLETFEANYSEVKDTFGDENGYGADQFSFMRDGTKWAYTLSRNPTAPADTNIIYADFPNKEGKQLDSGKWGQVQGPLISTDGKLVIYRKNDGEPNSPYYVWLYDSSDDSKRKITQGEPEAWVNNDGIIVSRPNPETGSDLYPRFLVNIKTGQETPME